MKKFIVTTEKIASFNPCKDRFNNFKLHYGEKYENSFERFLDLENITYDDKIWVAKRMLSKQVLVEWALACAQSVQHIFNEKYPDNPAVSNLLDYMCTIQDFESMTDEQKDKLRELRNAADDASYAADDASYAAAYAASYAAAYAADASYAAAYAAYAADAAAAYAAYAADAAAARKIQQDLNLSLLSSIIQRKATI